MSEDLEGRVRDCNGAYIIESNPEQDYCPFFLSYEYCKYSKYLKDGFITCHYKSEEKKTK